ncbi:sensor histidine kinase [Dactylosporangium sp. CA-139066]|uniref:sensor histidine kinase n=1 Tax=Dactylosporangium sp. CA-139066 TaxID=3239930 RepID=UPI003D92E0A2
MLRPRMSFTRQTLVLQVVVITVVVGLGLLVFGWLLDRELTTQYGERARGVAHSVAADPTIVEAATRFDPGTGRHDPDGVVQARAEAVRQATGVLFVVVTDRDGLRLSHPNASEVGRLVSTDPSEALAGRDVVTVQRGTLGDSARAKVPLRDQAGQVVGIVSVGIDLNDIETRWWGIVAVAGLFAVGSFAIGAAGAALLTWRLRRLTLGLEPRELAELMQEREAVLHGIREGVLAVDAADRISVYNGEAERLLGSRPPVGTAPAEIDLPAGIRSALSDDSDADNLVIVAADRVLIANRRQVRRDGRNLGRVLTLRDRTDLETLTSDLGAVRALTEGLRAQQHEFSNRLHLIAGLFETGHHTEAMEYLRMLSPSSVSVTDTDNHAIRDPYLRAFLAAKTALATEKGVRLDIGEESWVAGRVTAPVDVITIVGNLLDNAIDAARLGSARPAWVEVVLAAERDTLHVSVADSGDGIAASMALRVFAQGVSTRAGDSRGLGLALSRQAARSLGGEVWLAQPGGDGQGAVFAARLPAVLAVAAEVES